MQIESNVNIFKSFATWILKYSERNQVKVILMFLIVLQFFSGFYKDRAYDIKIAALESKISKLEQIQEKNIRLEKDMNKMSSDIVMFKAAYDYFPFPYWIKSTQGVMIYCNAAFVEKYGKPKGKTANDIIGYRDIDTWTKEEASRFRVSDSIVIVEDRPMTFMPAVNNGKYMVTKFPYKLNDMLLGVAGVEYRYFK